MADQIKVRGMVISSSPIGENDKRVVLLTKEKGKISAFVRGARRPGNHLMAASDSFSFGIFYLMYGRDAYTVVNAEISNFFRELTSDLQKTYTAYYFLELAEYFTVENEDESMMLNLIYASFSALVKGRINPRLIRYIFELKTLVINGEYPEFFVCRNCGTKEHLTGFSIFHDGILCTDCAKVSKDVMEINGSTLYALQYIVYSDIKNLFTFVVSDEVLTEMKMVMARCMHAYVDKKMNSLEILDVLD